MGNRDSRKPSAQERRQDFGAARSVLYHGAGSLGLPGSGFLDRGRVDSFSDGARDQPGERRTGVTDHMWSCDQGWPDLLGSSGCFAGRHCFRLAGRLMPDVDHLEWREVAAGTSRTSPLFSQGKLMISRYSGKTSFSSTYLCEGSLVALLVSAYYWQQVFARCYRRVPIHDRAADLFGKSIAADKP